MLRNDRRPRRSRRWDHRLYSVCVAASALLAHHAQVPAHRPAMKMRRSSPIPAAVEFFEKNVRPILATRCQGCHGPAKQKGGLRLDVRAALIAGGSTGPAVVPGNPKESLLVDAINYGETYQMPPKSKLPAAEIATLTDGSSEARPGESRREPIPARPASSRFRQVGCNCRRKNSRQRARHWSFQPIRRGDAPQRRSAGRRTGRGTRSIASSWRPSPSTGSHRPRGRPAHPDPPV